MGRCVAALGLALLSGCADFVRYTDELVEPRTGRSFVVTGPASLGGLVGFVAGLPVDVVALPVTYPIYRSQAAEDPVSADPTSTMLFPSFALSRVGRLVLGAPFDVLEYGVYRAWRSPQGPGREDQEAFEILRDQETLQIYSVEPVLPRGAATRPAGG